MGRNAVLRYGAAILVMLAGCSDASGRTAAVAPAPAAVTATAPADSAADQALSAGTKAVAVVTPVDTAPTPSAPAGDRTGSRDTDVLGTSALILLRLFVLAVVLESAMTVIFQWRPVAASLDPRAARPLATFIVAAVLVLTLDLDIVGALARSYAVHAGTAAAADSWVTVLLTALVLAGGSAGINTMLRSLGYRSIEPDPVHVRPPPTEAWIAVRWRGDAVANADRLDVLIRKEGDADWSIIGTVATTGGKLLGWLFRDRRSFPPSGGFVVPLGVPTAVAIARAGGTPVAAGTWGPRTFVAGALVDIVFKEAV